MALIVVDSLIGASLDRRSTCDVAAVTLAAWVVPGCLVWLLVPPHRGR